MSKRDEYVEKLKAQIDAWNAQLHGLEAKAGQAKANAQIKYQEEMAALRRMRDETRKKLAKIEEASEEAWEGLKSGMEEAWTNLKEALEKARSKWKS